VVPNNAGDKIFMAIQELSENQEATPLRGWIPVPEVVNHLKSKLKGIGVWDVMAAGLACGYPRDLAYLEVQVERNGRDLTAVMTKVLTKDAKVEDVPWTKDG